MAAALAIAAAIRPSPGWAALTQGDLTIYGFAETREAGRWGEGSSNNNAVPAKFTSASVETLGTPATESGGSFGFTHWDLTEARQVGSIRPNYNFVKNHKLLGRFDLPFLENANLFAYYRPWYDAFGQLKSTGRAEAFRDYRPYTGQDIWQRYAQDNLHEYYADLNFTDNFSMRIGKQLITWSEGNLLAGTEITNPGDVSYHGFVGAESPEDARKALDMVKMNYVLPDFLNTANNEIEAFWIPGDFEGAGCLKSNLTLGLTQVDTDPRDPYAVPVSLARPCSLVPYGGAGKLLGNSISRFLYNQAGQPVRVTSLLDLPAKPMVLLTPLGFSSNFYDLKIKSVSNSPSRKPIDNSEFGVRYSTLLPVGDGLQTSFIFLYEARSPLGAVCTECPAPKGYLKPSPGAFLGVGKYIYGKPRPGVPKAGTLLLLETTDYRRNPYFGLTGTYFDQDFTNAVFRYDALYAPRVAVSVPETRTGTGAKWTEISRLVFGIDRPTMIPILYPYLTKQHTLVTFQTTETFYPDLPAGATPSDPLGKIRRLSTFLTLTGTNFMMDGKLVNLSGPAWDVDDQTGQFVSSTSYRYTHNVLFGVNVDWYLGRSGRHTDPYLESKSQRINELEFTITYEL